MRGFSSSIQLALNICLLQQHIALAFRQSISLIRPAASLLSSLAMSGNSNTNFKIITSGTDEDADDAFGKAIGPMPTVSSRINFADDTPRNIQHELWIVGAGTLGELVASQFKDQHPDASIIAETRSTNRHAAYNRLGVRCRLREERSDADEKTARNVIIALPPSSSEDYLTELSNACRLWAGPLGGGQMVFTSSVVSTTFHRIFAMLAAECPV
jgi:hypothetical protein